VKNALKIVTTVFFAAYVLILSCGFSLSHVYCPEGEQWILGAEMPPCKHCFEVESSSCKSDKKCADVPEKNNDNRKKDTFTFKFDIEGKEVSTPDTKFINYDLLPNSIASATSVAFFLDIALEKNYLRFHPPPDLLKPDLTNIQVFRI
jgi:hypothetical protein